MEAKVFAQRRERFLGQLDDAVAIIAAHPEQLRNGDVHHDYRQDSDLLYLTGFTEPESAVLLNPASETPYVLFVRERDREKEIWNGRRAGVEGALERFGADAAFPIGELASRLPELVSGASSIVTALGRNPDFDRTLIDLVQRSRRTRQKEGKGPVDILDVGSTLHEMRLCKEPEEQAAMQRAGDISAAAHRRAMQMALPGVAEYQIQAALEEVFRREGARRVGYGSIVASGENATILHYVENDRVVRDGDLVLIDAGGEFDHYTADITRTFPASGSFTAPQRRIYDVVLRAQQEAIDQAHPGRPWERVHDRAVAVLIEGLISLGLLSGSTEENLEKKTYRKFYMHGTSHWLGMDVHDVGTYKIDGQPRPLEPGMVMTVEPGLYFHPDLEDIPDEYRGIGVRIEDDILITETGHTNLTEAAPKTVADIEALLAERESLVRA